VAGAVLVRARRESATTTPSHDLDTLPHSRVVRRFYVDDDETGPYSPMSVDAIARWRHELADPDHSSKPYALVMSTSPSCRGI